MRATVKTNLKNHGSGEIVAGRRGKKKEERKQIPHMGVKKFKYA